MPCSGVAVRIITNGFGDVTCEGKIAPFDFLALNGVKIVIFTSTTFAGSTGATISFWLRWRGTEHAHNEYLLSLVNLESAAAGGSGSLARRSAGREHGVSARRPSVDPAAAH